MPNDPNATQTWPNSDDDWPNSRDGYQQFNEDLPEEGTVEDWDELGYDTFVWNEDQGRFVQAIPDDEPSGV